MTFEGRGMDGIAAEVAQEIAVLLQHHDPDARARQQEAQHHARRAAAHDAASGRDQSSISRSTRPVAVIASNAGTPSGPSIQSLVAEQLMQSMATRSGLLAASALGDGRRFGPGRRWAPAPRPRSSSPGRAHFDASFSPCSASGIRRPSLPRGSRPVARPLEHARGEQHVLVAGHGRELAGAGIDHAHRSHRPAAYRATAGERAMTAFLEIFTSRPPRKRV